MKSKYRIVAVGADRARSILGDIPRERWGSGQRVYFARSGVAIKIGFTRDPGRRISELDGAGFGPIEKMLIVADFGKAAEAALHRRCAPENLHGEWFARGGATEVLMGMLSEVAVGGAPLVGCWRKSPWNKIQDAYYRRPIVSA